MLKPTQVEQVMECVFKTYSHIDSGCCKQNQTGELKTCVECERKSFLDNDIQKYACSNYQRVYLIRTFPAQLALTNKIVESHKSLLVPLMSGRKRYLTAVSYGGGPGTDLVCLVHNLAASDDIIDFRFDNLDIPAWKHIYEALAGILSAKCKDINVQFITKFKPQDVRVKRIYERARRDIIFISWVFSHLSEIDIANAIRNAYHNSQPTGTILIAHRIEKRVIDMVNAGIEALYKPPVSDLPVIQQDEAEFSCEVEFPEDIKRRYEPRLKYKTHYWIIQHPKKHWM